MKKRITMLVLVTASLTLAVGVGRATAATTTIDFDSLNGPSFFCVVPASPVTIGVATFSGGAIMTAVSGLAADQTTVYGSSPCLGGAPTITITFSRPVSDFSVQLFNGETTTVSYTVADNLGGTSTKSITPFFVSGVETFVLSEVGITSVTITTSSSSWDFFIDNVRFTALPMAAAECKDGGWETFGAFKNQGDCVAWVQTEGRNAPG
jgi:hypothetical protein